MTLTALISEGADRLASGGKAGVQGFLEHVGHKKPERLVPAFMKLFPPRRGEDEASRPAGSLPQVNVSTINIHAVKPGYFITPEGAEALKCGRGFCLEHDTVQAIDVSRVTSDAPDS